MRQTLTKYIKKCTYFSEVEDLDDLIVVEDEDEEPVITANKRKLEEIDTPSAKKLKISDKI